MITCAYCSRVEFSRVSNCPGCGGALPWNKPVAPAPILERVECDCTVCITSEHPLHQAVTRVRALGITVDEAGRALQALARAL